ncbi:MAG: hypothetical protein ABI432_15045, partial [Flavobacteriales bacterium]
SSTIAQRWRTVWPIWRGLLMCSAPALLLTIAYFLTHPEGRAELRHLPVAELWTGLLNGRPFVALTDAEGPYARAFAWVLAAMTIAVVVRHLGKGKSDGQRAGSSWLAIMALVMVVGYFVLPDQMATGAFASIRLLLFAYLLWALWLGVQRIGRIPMALLMTAYIAADLLALKIHYANTEGLNGEVAEMLTVAPSIPEHAVILPLNYGDNWLHSNFPCYLGTMRNAVILDNFCALAPHNPVHWKAGTDPNGTIGSFATSDRPCVDLDAYILEGDTLVDYVFTWKLSEAITDSCTNDLRKQLASAFDLAAVSPRGDARLYRRRK